MISSSTRKSLLMHRRPLPLQVRQRAPWDQGIYRRQSRPFQHQSLSAKRGGLGGDDSGVQGSGVGRGHPLRHRRPSAGLLSGATCMRGRQGQGRCYLCLARGVQKIGLQRRYLAYEAIAGRAMERFLGEWNWSRLRAEENWARRCLISSICI